MFHNKRIIKHTLWINSLSVTPVIKSVLYNDESSTHPKIMQEYYPAIKGSCIHTLTNYNMDCNTMVKPVNINNEKII